MCIFTTLLLPGIRGIFKENVIQQTDIMSNQTKSTKLKYKAQIFHTSYISDTSKSRCIYHAFTRDNFLLLRARTNYLRRTLVSIWNSIILLVLTKFHFEEEDWALAFNSMKFDIILNFPNFLRSQVLSRLATREATRIYQFITNNQALFHLWWKKNLVKRQQFSKYYDHVVHLQSLQ